MPAKEIAAYKRVLGDIHVCLVESLLQKPSLDTLFTCTITEMQESIQAVHAKSTSDELEVNWYHFVRHIVGQSSVAALMGRSFVESYPQLVDDLQDFDTGFLWLMSGLPAWVPIDSLRRAHRARKRLMYHLGTFLRSLDDKSAQRNFVESQAISQIVHSLDNTMKQGGLTVDSRCSLLLSLLWASQVNVANTVFWLLSRIYAEPTLLNDIRRETALCVDTGGASDPVFTSTARSSPVLKAAFLETLRMYHTP